MSALTLAALADPGFLRRQATPADRATLQPLRGPVCQGGRCLGGWKPEHSPRRLRPRRSGQPGKTRRQGLGTGVRAYTRSTYSTRRHCASIAARTGRGLRRRLPGALDAGGQCRRPVTGPASMTGYTILSVAGYAPEFVKHSALAAWGPLPADVKIEATGQILSALRRVASGEPGPRAA